MVTFNYGTESKRPDACVGSCSCKKSCRLYIHNHLFLQVHSFCWFYVDLCSRATVHSPESVFHDAWGARKSLYAGSSIWQLSGSERSGSTGHCPDVWPQRLQRRPQSSPLHHIFRPGHPYPPKSRVFFRSAFHSCHGHRHCGRHGHTISTGNSLRHLHMDSSKQHRKVLGRGSSASHYIHWTFNNPLGRPLLHAWFSVTYIASLCYRVSWRHQCGYTSTILLKEAPEDPKAKQTCILSNNMFALTAIQERSLLHVSSAVWQYCT